MNRHPSSQLLVVHRHHRCPRRPSSEQARQAFDARHLQTITTPSVMSKGASTTATMALCSFAGIGVCAAHTAIALFPSEPLSFWFKPQVT